MEKRKKAFEQQTVIEQNKDFVQFLRRKIPKSHEPADRRMVLAFRALYLSNGTGFFALCFSFVFVHECASVASQFCQAQRWLNTPISGSCISGAGFKCNCK
ncbi:MAG: hypothetical protein LIO54_02560 [Oscillospiraceae bacterium]|nr:hypothetical protein [Oscillospiraceae bacterium]